MAMIEINLLPKNFQKRSIDFSFGKTGLYAMVVAGLFLFGMLGTTYVQKRQISRLESNIDKARQRVILLQKDIKLVDALMDVKSKVAQRMIAVEKLDSHRSVWVRLLEDMSRNVPDFVWLTRFNEVVADAPKQGSGNPKGGQSQQAQPAVAEGGIPEVRPAEIEGFAFTLNSLASFMIRMMRSDYFDEIELRKTEELDLQGKKAYNFVLTCKVHYLSDQQLQDLAAAAAEQDNDTSGSTHRSLN